jgi:hypothetical protein
VDNTVTLSQFNFGPGGGFLGSLPPSSTIIIPNNTLGSVAFMPSATAPLRFVLDVTTNTEGCCGIPGEFIFGGQASNGPITPDISPAIFISITDPLLISAQPSHVREIELSAPTLGLAPEPGTWVLVLSGLLGLLAIHRHKHGYRRDSA